MQPRLPLSLAKKIVDRGNRASIVGHVHTRKVARRAVRRRLHERAVLEEERCPISNAMRRTVANRTADNRAAAAVSRKQAGGPTVADDAVILDQRDVRCARRRDARSSKRGDRRRLIEPDEPDTTPAFADVSPSLLVGAIRDDDLRVWAI